ncbi:MAG: tripartite motif-containing protein 71 [Thermoleophilaceae bacterium]|nr:tripartite motif-containing protein 71 [Thermoleophilaceae bacterium]
MNARLFSPAALAAAAALTLALPAAASADLSLVSQWGSAGTGNGQFQVPSGIAVDGAGNVYVSDQNGNRIEKFDSSGTFLTAWGGSGNGSGKFNGPAQVKVDPQGNVLVNDSGNYRVQRFTPTGGFIQQIGGFGSGAGQFSGNPRGIGADGAGNVYVLDAGEGGVVSKFSPSGAFISSFGSVGAGPGQWNNPHGLGVTPQGEIYVGDTNNHRIDVFTTDGGFVRSFGTTAGTGQIGSPNDIAFDSQGNVWVDDTAPAGLVEFGADGVPLSRTSTAAGASDPFRSSGVAIGPADDVFATDNLKSRVLRFRQAPPPPQLGTTANAQAVSGLVKVRTPGASGFVTLGRSGVTQIPIGSMVDTKKGTVSLTLAKNKSGGTQTGTFKGGRFKVAQSTKLGQKGLTELSLTGGSFKGCSAKGARAARRSRSRRLFSSVHGRFRTRGRNSTATVRGTKWLTKDTCAGTLTQVMQGTVIVRDFRLRKNITLKKGQRYLARPRAARR